MEYIIGTFGGGQNIHLSCRERNSYWRLPGHSARLSIGEQALSVVRPCSSTWRLIEALEKLRIVAVYEQCPTTPHCRLGWWLELRNAIGWLLVDLVLLFITIALSVTEWGRADVCASGN